MTDDTRKPEQIEEQVQEAPETETAMAEEASDSRRRGSFISRWGWIFVLLIAIGIGLLLTPADVRQKWFAESLATLEKSPVQPVAKHDTPEPQPVVQHPAKSASQPVAKQPEEAKEEEAALQPVPVSKPVVTPAPKPVYRPATTTKPAGIDENEARQLLDAMSNLQQELSVLRDEQQNLRKTQTEQQRLQLKTRLGWIANPVNHLPQIEQAWEEVSRMPTLSEDERQKAQSMYSLAHQRHADIQRWQQALNDAAARLRPQEHNNIIPRPEHPWLKWLFGQFSLKRAPGEEERRMLLLQRQLQKTARDLQMEQWPDALAWQKLHARVQLQLAEQPGNTAEEMPRLPDNFSDIASDIGQLRQVAQAWQEQL